MSINLRKEIVGFHAEGFLCLFVDGFPRDLDHALLVGVVVKMACLGHKVFGSTSWLFLLELCGQSGEISKPLGLSLSHLESGNANISSLR